MAQDENFQLIFFKFEEGRSLTISSAAKCCKGTFYYISEKAQDFASLLPNHRDTKLVSSVVPK